MCMACIVHSGLPEQLLVPAMGVKKIIYWKIILDSRNYALTITFSRLEVSSADPLFTLLKEACTYI